MRRAPSVWLKRLLIASAALYAADYASLRLGVPPRERFSDVTVQRYYVIPQKSQTGVMSAYQPADSSIVRCVNSLFPHDGDSPCWYVRRHTSVPIEL